MKTDFDFLKRKFPEIYNHVSVAIDNATIDEDIAAFKIRKALELLLQEISAFENIFIPTKLNDALKLLRKNKIIPDDIYSKCEVIRLVGNDGVHNNSVDILDIKKVMNCLLSICVWFNNHYELGMDHNDAFYNNPDNSFENRYSVKIPAEDKEFFNNLLSWSNELVNKHICMDYEVLTVNSVLYVSFDDYCKYYRMALQEMANYSNYSIGITPEMSLKCVLRLKDIIRQSYWIDDDMKIIKTLASMLYKHTKWYLFS